MTPAIALCVVAMTVTASSAATAAAAKIIADGAKFERIVAKKFTFTEGVVAARDGTVYFIDMNDTGGAIYRYQAGSSTAVKLIAPAGMANGLHIDRNGDLLIAQAGDRAVLRRNLATGASKVLADRNEGKRLNSPNDLTSDAQGRIFFTDVRYQGDDPLELPNAVYRIDPDGRIARIAADVLRPNGIEVSPDGRRLYVAVCNTKALPPNPIGPVVDRFGFSFGGVVVYDLSAQGEVSNGRVFYRDDGLGADGMAMDSDGDLYVALHNEADSGEIVVVDPSGTVLTKITPPQGVAPVNLGFGRGSDSHTLYLTSGFKNGGALYRIPTNRRGYFPGD